MSPEPTPMVPDPSPNRRTRVVRLIPVLDYGGVETTFVQQARSIDRRRFDFRVCTFWKRGTAAAQIEASGIRVDELGVDPRIRNPRATSALLRYLRSVRPDVVHSSVGEANFHNALVGRASGARAVVLEEQGLPSRKRLGRIAHAALYRNVDAIVGVSDSSCRYLTDAEHAPRSRVRRIYNCAGSEFFTAPPARTGQGLHIATVGRLVDVKNHRGLIDAFAAAAKQAPELELTIIGDGPLAEPLSAHVRALGLEGRVRLPGFRSDIRDFLDGVDAFALPSFSEGFGIALVEAMARGLPVFASTAGALPELMADRATEWSREPTDVQGWTDMLLRFTRMSPSERLALGTWARTRAEVFSPAAHIREIHRLYDELTGQEP